MPAPSSFGSDTTNNDADGADIVLKQLKNPSVDDITAITGLWIATGLIPTIRNARQDIENCISARHGSLIVARHPGDGQIIATIMIGHDDIFGWIHYLAIAKHVQGNGIGRNLMILAEDILRTSGLCEARVTVENTTAGDFYIKLGYDFIDNITDQTIPDTYQNTIMRKSLTQ